MFGQVKITLIVIIIAGLVSAGGIFYAKYTRMVDELESTKVKLQTVQESLNNLEEQKKKEEIAITQLQDSNKALEEQKDKYLSIFRDHDLTKLSAAKPGMIETRINKETQRLFEELENETR